MNDDQARLRAAYKRAGIGLGLAAVLWLIAYFVAQRSGWEERSLIIPIAAAALSVLCFSLYFRSKSEE
jgi:hypothetical protein